MQWNPETFFFKDCSRLRSREVKGLLRTHRLVCVCMCMCVCIYIYIYWLRPLPSGTSGKESACACKRSRFDPWVGKMEEMVTHSSISPGESHGQRRLAGYSPQGCQESDTTEWLSTHTDHAGSLFLKTVLDFLRRSLRRGQTHYEKVRMEAVVSS